MSKYPDERYKVDIEFKMLVDELYKMIKLARFTSTDIKEAALLAQIHYEWDNPRPIMVSPDLQRILRDRYDQP